MNRNKINKIRKSKLADRLRKIAQVETIKESFVFSFGQYKDMKIREVIICDFKYVDWCIQEKIFILNESLQKLYDNTVKDRTFDEQEQDDWAKMFD